MRGDAATMEVLRPRTAAEALAALEKEPGALPFAGGTDAMVLWNLGLLNGRRVLDLSGVREWAALEARQGGATVGALATHAQVQRHAAISRRFPLLAKACATVGAVQIQNRGTLGGNIANASPAADTFPPLAVYQAVVRVASAEGERSLPFLDAFAGVKKTTLRPGELVRAVELKDPPKPSRQLFRKVGTRAAQAISKVVAAGLLWLEDDDRVRELRFSLGSMAPTVRRLSAAEAFVRGKRLDAGTIARACELLAEDVSPIDDIRSTREYRLETSRALLRAFLEGRP